MLVTHKLWESVPSIAQVGGKLSNPEPRQEMAEVLKVVPEGRVILIFAPEGMMFLFWKSSL